MKTEQNRDYKVVHITCPFCGDAFQEKVQDKKVIQLLCGCEVTIIMTKANYNFIRLEYSIPQEKYLKTYKL